ncbi:hypothetical protein Chor_007323 [Crotalus horridus]
MSSFFQTISNKYGSRQGSESIKEEQLLQWGLTDIHLHPYQIEGVNWMIRCYETGHGCILGDEMGLGKTCQMCLKDEAFLKRFNWTCLVVDEAQRLKNQDSLLHKTLSENSLRYVCHIDLLLVSVCYLKLWEDLQVVLQTYSQSFNHRNVKELHSLLQPLLLRRVKAEFSEEIPKKVEVVLYHGMSALQKKIYKALLMKDLDAFENESGKKANLQNVLIQLRKCVAHPYLFTVFSLNWVPFESGSTGEDSGDIHMPKLISYASNQLPWFCTLKQARVEPEPFVIGDHLIEASGKLNLLDKLLSFLYDSYERLDGSVRGEERHLAINNFGQQPIFVFLLSTKAGGVGINLTAADTVIFVDSDFNPQNDVQAAARAHRIGQKKLVKIIRLVGRDTVEEIIYRRAISKLQLTNTVIEGGQFALGAHKTQDISDGQLNEILKFGLDKLLSSEGSTVYDTDLRSILGETKGGIWSMDPVKSVTEINEEQALESHMYIFEGKDYSKETSQGDKKAYDNLLEHQKTFLEDLSQGGSILRNKENVLMTADMRPSKKRQKLSPEELKVRQKKMQEGVAKRARLREEKRQRATEIEQQKKIALWEANHYQSCCLKSEESSEEEDEEEEKSQLHLEYTDSEQTSIKYIMGDVTHPIVGDEDAIIVHCVDDSGHWGRGGLFTALGNRSDQSKKIYELAGKMKDLTLGGTLLFYIDDKESRNKGTDLLALIVAQHRDHSNNLSGIKLPALEKGLKKIYQEAKKRNGMIDIANEQVG